MGVLSGICVPGTWYECVCLCVCLCLPAGRSLCAGPCVRACVLAGGFACLEFCVYMSAVACGLAWEQAVHSLQGWEARRQEGHSSGSPLTKPWRAGPSFLPTFPGSSHSSSASQAGAAGRAQAWTCLLEKSSPGRTLRHLKTDSGPGQALLRVPSCLTYVPGVPQRQGEWGPSRAQGRTAAEGTQAPGLAQPEARQASSTCPRVFTPDPVSLPGQPSCPHT